jgi:hypothetical protein
VTAPLAHVLFHLESRCRQQCQHQLLTAITAKRSSHPTICCDSTCDQLLQDMLAPLCMLQWPPPKMKLRESLTPCSSPDHLQRVARVSACAARRAAGGPPGAPRRSPPQTRWRWTGTRRRLRSRRTPSGTPAARPAGACAGPRQRDDEHALGRVRVPYPYTASLGGSTSLCQHGRPSGRGDSLAHQLHCEKRGCPLRLTHGAQGPGETSNSPDEPPQGACPHSACPEQHGGTDKPGRVRKAHGRLRGRAWASDHRRSVQSADADRKRPGRKGDQATAYTGPRWPAKLALYCSA